MVSNALRSSPKKGGSFEKTEMFPGSLLLIFRILSYVPQQVFLGKGMSVPFSVPEMGYRLQVQG